MTTEWGKLVTTICDRSTVWPTLLQTNRLVPEVFVKIGPPACALTILNDADVYVNNANEELLNFVRAYVRVMTLMSVN